MCGSSYQNNSILVYQGQFSAVESGRHGGVWMLEFLAVAGQRKKPRLKTCGCNFSVNA